VSEGTVESSPVHGTVMVGTSGVDWPRDILSFGEVIQRALKSEVETGCVG